MHKTMTSFFMAIQALRRSREYGSIVHRHREAASLSPHRATLFRSMRTLSQNSKAAI